MTELTGAAGDVRSCVQDRNEPGAGSTPASAQPSSPLAGAVTLAPRVQAIPHTIGSSLGVTPGGESCLHTSARHGAVNPDLSDN